MRVDLMDHEVGPAKEPPIFSPFLYGALHIAVNNFFVFQAFIAFNYLRSIDAESFAVPALIATSIAVLAWAGQFILNWTIRRLGYRVPTTVPASTREVWTYAPPVPVPPRPVEVPPIRETWGRSESTVAKPTGKPLDGGGISGEPVVVRANLRILASLGAICLVMALIPGLLIVVAHASSPLRWPSGVGWLYGVGAILVTLGGLGVWFGFGGQWETRFDAAGITWTRLSRARFVPWSLVGRVVVVRQVTALGPSTSLSLQDRQGRRYFDAIPIDPRRYPGSERILPLARIHLPHREVDPLADEAI